MDRQGVYSSSWPIAEASEDQQQLMVSTPQLCTHRKTVASLKVFTIVMLHSWRQRRKEVRELQDMVQRLQDNSMKTKNQLHVYGTLVRVEEKRNRELQIKLKQSTMSIDQVRSSCESLVNSVRDLTTEKIRLQTDLDQRSQKYDDLEKMSNNTKRLLSTAYMEQSYLQKQLISEQRIRRKLQEEKEQLIQEVVLAESREAKYRQVRDWYQHQLDEKKECIHIMRRRMALLEEKLRDIKDALVSSVTPSIGHKPQTNDVHRGQTRAEQPHATWHRPDTGPAPPALHLANPLPEHPAPPCIWWTAAQWLWFRLE
ncbi:uncharacterized protein LOC6529461 isoform X2 [Drosophila yakuba]|uniref:uncharacterized protein LOC6529461 isoform X2 n=1 Tax=Drosophila yakuba TaxID=7245 RepID=UPI0019308964|nr:uncharacterized protein LOC6529461 isoform X2 [Drosophila yakuba]